MSLKWPVGQFFVLLGVLMLILYFISTQTSSPMLLSFCSGVVLLMIGVYFLWTGRNPPTSSERFRILRGMSERRNKPKKRRGKDEE